MKIALTAICLLLVPNAVGQYQQTERPHGSLYGVAANRDGQPAKRVGLTAVPLGVSLGAILPHTTSDERGGFRFVLPWWGKYTVYVEDEDAGYSSFSTGNSGQSQPPEVDITPEHPLAEVTVTLPPKAAFLLVHLTSGKTSLPIVSMSISVLHDTHPSSLVFSMGCSSTTQVLLPPDKDLLVHITSDGFREWQESVGSGKMFRLGSGQRLTLNVELDPEN